MTQIHDSLDHKSGVLTNTLQGPHCYGGNAPSATPIPW